MATQRLLTGESPTIHIRHVAGDLSLRGWNQPELTATCDGEIGITQSEGAVELALDGDTSLQVPSLSRVRIELANGDLAASGVRGGLTLDKVEGDLSVRDTGALTIGLVEGDCSVRMVRGDCSVRRIEGDGSFAAVAGNLTIEQCTDDLSVSGVHGSVSARSSDDVALRLVLRPGSQVSVHAGGDLVCRMRAEADVAVELSAGNDLEVRRLTLPSPIRGNRARFVLSGATVPPSAEGAEGEGDSASAETTQAVPAASLLLVAGADLALIGLSPEEVGEMDFDFNFDFAFDFGPRAAGLVQQFATQLEAQVGAFAKQMDEKMNNIGNTEQIATKLQEGILAAARKAEEKIGEAMRRMEARQREADKRQGGQWGGAWASWSPASGGQAGFGPRPSRAPVPPTPPAPPQPPRPAVNDEERLMVLRMVSEGKISVEQAEKLLAALTGRTPGADAER